MADNLAPREKLDPKQSSISFYTEAENVGPANPIAFSVKYIVSRTREGRPLNISGQPSESHPPSTGVIGVTSTFEHFRHMFSH